MPFALHRGVLYEWDSEQARTGQRFLQVTMNRSPWEPTMSGLLLVLRGTDGGEVEREREREKKN